MKGMKLEIGNFPPEADPPPAEKSGSRLEKIFAAGKFAVTS